MGAKVNTLDAAYADPLNPMAVLDLALADARAQRNWAWHDRLSATRAAFVELIDATAALEPERRPMVLRLRAALAKVQP